MVSFFFYNRSIGVGKNRLLCTKWRHVACSMDMILSKNSSESNVLISTYSRVCRYVGVNTVGNIIGPLSAKKIGE